MTRLQTALSATALAGALLATAIPAQAGQGSGPSVVATNLQILGQVSHDGGTFGESDSAGFIRDNPTLLLEKEWVERRDENGEMYRVLSGVYLRDSVLGERVRIDTDPSGSPLAPAVPDPGWVEEGTDLDRPGVFLATESVSRGGNKVAFCTNYGDLRAPVLFVKDLGTGALAETPLRCGIDADEGDEDVIAPQISEDGKVVHVNGDRGGVDEGHPYSLGDKLYFTAGSGSVRHLNGHGSMTRDGGTLFMRVGVHAKGTLDTTKGKVGAYNIRTGKTTTLPGKNSIYGTPFYRFSAVDQATRRGRFVVAYGTTVIDRTYGLRTDIAAVLRQAGYEPLQVSHISGSGRVVFAEVAAPAGSGRYSEVVAITGWEPTARVKVKAIGNQSKLRADVNPNKGKGYWKFQVQQLRPDGSWKMLKTYNTQGSKETRTVNLPKGTYRVVVKAKYGHQGTTSGPVYLMR